MVLGISIVGVFSLGVSLAGIPAESLLLGF